VSTFTHRIATEADIPALVALMDRSITGPLADFLTPDQIAASRRLMGIDSQIITDRTYFIVESDGVFAGCGGWSGRITEYGGDHTPGREPAPLTPGIDAARIRAMYTAPEYLRRGVGRLILGLCETAWSPPWAASPCIFPPATSRSIGSRMIAAARPCRWFGWASH
jgi:GNAT superfamily N-acetyltransferase